MRVHRNYDAFGNVIDEEHFDASGDPVLFNDSGYVDLAFGFTGRYLDSDTGLQNNLNRWYDSSTGRWLSEDPIGFEAGDANLYRYVENSPTNYVDPSGLWSLADALDEAIKARAIRRGWPRPSPGPSDQNIPPSLDGTWKVSICANEDHAWIRYENVDTGEVHTTGRYHHGWGGVRDEDGFFRHPPSPITGIVMDQDIRRDADQAARRDVIIDNPSIPTSGGLSGYGPLGNNCATYATDAWYELTGERLGRTGPLLYDDPAAVERSINPPPPNPRYDKWSRIHPRK